MKGCCTPKSSSRIPDGADSPVGMKRSSVMDKESPNCGGQYTGKEVMPLKEMDYLKDAPGQA